MMDLHLFVPPAGTGGLAGTAAQLLDQDRRVDAKEHLAGTFEHDAYEYSGRHSTPLRRAPQGPTPTTTTVASPDIKEDENQKTYESLSNAMHGMAATVGRVAGMAVPLAMAGGLLSKAPTKEG